MTRPRQPRQFHIGGLALGKGGPRPITEPVPADNRKREVVAVRKFAASLQAMLGRTLTDIARLTDPEWLDFTANEGTRKWAIEVTEAIEQAHAEQASDEAEYQEALVAALRARAAPDSGVQFRVSIGHSGQKIPHLASMRGQRLLQALLGAILSEIAAAHRLSFGQFKVCKISDPIPSTVFCLRTPPCGPFPALFVGRGYDLTADEAASALARAVRRKIDKNYARTAEHKMLLVYTSRAFPAGVDPEEYALARSVLHGHPGHFDEVWHCWLMPDGLVSPITLVWPSSSGVDG